MSAEQLKTTEGPGLPLVARLYMQGRYRRASVDPNHAGQALTFLSAAGEWRQKAELRQAMIDQLTAEIDSLRATPTPPEPVKEADVSDAELMRAIINACDSLNITRLHELGGQTRTICEEAGLLEIGRAVLALRGHVSAIRDEALEEAAKEVERIGPKGSVALLTKGFADAIRALRGRTA